MSDFFQTGAVATVHRLGRPNVQRLEQELERFSEETPMALVLPCHIKELGTQALKLIVRELKGVSYLKQIVVGIDGATRRRDYCKARTLFRQLPQRPTLLWNDGPRMQALYKQLDAAELSAGPCGKWTEPPMTPCRRARAGATVRERLKTQAGAAFWRAMTAWRVKFPG